MSWGKLNHTVAFLKQKVSEERRGLCVQPAMGVLCTQIGNIFPGRVNSKLLCVS